MHPGSRWGKQNPKRVKVQKMTRMHTQITQTITATKQKGRSSVLTGSINVYAPDPTCRYSLQMRSVSQTVPYAQTWSGLAQLSPAPTSFSTGSDRQGTNVEQDHLNSCKRLGQRARYKHSTGLTESIEFGQLDTTYRIIIRIDSPHLNWING